MPIRIHSVKGPELVGRRRMITGKIDFGVYPTGGEEFNLAPHGLAQIDCVPPIFDGVRWYRLSKATTPHKLMAYTASNTQVGNATDLSAVVDVDFVAFGL